MSNKFLFELGTEEIPAGMISRALSQLQTAFEDLFSERQISWSRVRTFSTPRRLAILVEGLPDREPDRDEVVTGPPASIAFNDAGEPQPPALGFARKLGVDVSSLSVVKSDKGAYLSLLRLVEGKAVSEILQGSLPDLISAISWPKNMYWTQSRFRFIRPLRWFVCLWNDQVIRFDFEGVTADRVSRGHRLLGSSEIEIDSVDEYVDRLRENYVIVESEERRQRIIRGIEEEVQPENVLEDPDLLEMVINLNEYPTVLRGAFSESYLNIPSEVLVTVMRFHQKYFSVTQHDGSLAPAFLTVINTHGDAADGIRKGHEKVLQARLEDASFFWESDQKQALETRTESLDHVLFQEKLGTYLDKTRRVGKICSRLDGGDDLKQAALICKSDLTTDMVREFPELQGVMGGLYAREEGQPEAVWRAVYDQYKPVSFDDSLPSNRTGALLSVADRLDTIVGCFTIGIVPSGSSDPFALRRQAQGLVSILLRDRLRFSLENLVSMALENFSCEAPEEARQHVVSFIERRVLSILQRKGIPQDVLKAVAAVGIPTPHDASDRALALSQMKDEKDLEALAVAFKRTRNILAKYQGEMRPVAPELLVEEAEKSLYEAYQMLTPVVLNSLEEGDYLNSLKEIAGIRGIVDRFFDEVLVMAEDQNLRENRLALLNDLSTLFLRIADISEVVQQGGVS